MEDKEILKRQFQTPLYRESPVIAPAPAGPPPATNVHNVTDRIEEEQTNANLALRWRPSNDVMTYAAFASGFKGGGFDYFIAEPQSTILNNIRFADEQGAEAFGGLAFSGEEGGFETLCQGASADGGRKNRSAGHWRHWCAG